MLDFFHLIVLMRLISFIECEIQPFIINGTEVDIQAFAHVAFLSTLCHEKPNVKSAPWLCGASIVNEKVLLTAAHCVVDCYSTSTMDVTVGHHNRNHGSVFGVYQYYVHEHYRRGTGSYDIAMVSLKKPLRFGRNVKRVAIMRDPPDSKTALVAGWGAITTKPTKLAVVLRYIKQYLWERKDCSKMLSSLPRGTICAGSKQRYAYVTSFVGIVECEIEPFIVGGKVANIKTFPHSVFLGIVCRAEGEPDSPFICGASIVNQKITLTAAHCLTGCKADSFINISVGHANKDDAMVFTGDKYLIHEKYKKGNGDNDIGLVSIKNGLNFGDGVKRVVLMPNPPYFEKTQVAGWGRINDDRGIIGNLLQYVDQHVWKSKACRQYVEILPKGTICASSGNNSSFAARGDSGSALVVRGYIQIGLVSYKLPKVSKSLVVYTDTGYFYEWIKKNSRRLYCA